MADLGRSVLGTYSASCEKIKQSCPVGQVPQIGDIVFFSEATEPKTNHAGLIYKVTASTIYTIEGDTSGQPGLVVDGSCVATKSYSKVFNRVLSYGRPKYSEKTPASKVIDIAIQEVGYQEKKSKSKLDSKTANAGLGNYTKYGQWIGANGATWSGSFICWCFSAAFDSTFSGVIGNDPSETAINDEESTVYASQSSSNSSLASYINRLTVGVSGPRTRPIECITIHTAKKIGDIYDLAVMLNSSEKCYNYGIDNSGTIGLFTDEALWTDSSNSLENDNRSINIICMNQLLEPGYRISDECYASLVKLCEDICRRNFILALKYTGDPKTDSITFHQQFNNKSNCPGPYVADTAVPKLIEEVNDKLGTIIDPVTGAVIRKAVLATSQTEALKAQSTISIKSIKPYVIQPNRSMLNLDYLQLKQLGVVGTMIDGGERFDRNHNLVTYRTENVYKQTEEAQAANMPHAYIYTTHARNVAEVKEEAYWFYFVVSKYPPKLGVWLHCEFDVLPSVAEQLVDEWYSYFVKWGLKSKCGLYASKIQARKINWPKQCAYMPLWLEGELTDNVCPDEELLTPSFFKLDNLQNQSNQKEISNVIGTETNLGEAGAALLSQIGLSLQQIKEQLRKDSEEKAVIDQTDTYTDVFVPNDVNYSGRKSWEGYASITKQNQWAYKISHSDDMVTDEGFCKIDSRYLIAVGNGVSSAIGTYLDVKLQNGTIIECIVGDIIPDNVLDPVNHIFATNDESYSCTNFIVVNKVGVLNPDVRKTGDCSNKQDDWKSPVVSFRVYNTNWFIQE